MQVLRVSGAEPTASMQSRGEGTAVAAMMYVQVGRGRGVGGSSLLPGEWGDYVLYIKLPPLPARRLT